MWNKYLVGSLYIFGRRAFVATSNWRNLIGFASSWDAIDPLSQGLRPPASIAPEISVRRRASAFTPAYRPSRNRSPRKLSSSWVAYIFSIVVSNG